MKKNLLVTGGAGFIGSNFVELMVQKGHDVTVLDSMTYAGHAENLDAISGTGKHRLVKGQIQDRPLVEKLLKEHSIDYLLNFAAESHVDRSIDGPRPFIETNIIGTFELLSAALGYYNALPTEKKAGFRYLQISTDEVYGSLGATGKFTEMHRYEPNSPYSASKASADMLARAWHHTFHLPTLTTNCSNNYGPKQFPEKLIPHMILCALSGRKLPVYGNGSNIRDWIYVKDHCEGIYLALTKGAPGSTYCFGGDSERTNMDVVNAICALLDEMRPLEGGKSYKTQIEFVADRPGHDQRYAIDDSLAQKELGFTRSMKRFEDGLKSTLQWYLSHFDWCEKVLGKNKGKVTFDWSSFKA